MKLSIHLFKSSVTSFAGLLPDKYDSGDDALTKLNIAAGLPFECEAYACAHDNDQPKWVKFVGGHIDLSAVDLPTRSHSFVMFLKAKNRFFAITFGLGFNCIDRSKIERRFGMKVALNTLTQDGLTTLDARNTDLITKQRRIHVSKGSPVYEFGIEPTTEMLRFVSGKLPTGDFAASVSGSDGLTITAKVKFEELGDFCAALLAHFTSTKYREHFDFIDFLEPLDDSDPLVPLLEGKLTAAVKSRTTDKLMVAFPEIEFANAEKLHVFKVFHGHDHGEYEEFTLNEVYAFLDAHNGLEDELAEIHVIGLDDADSPATRKRPLWDFFAFETQHKGSTFILMCGQWLKVQKKFDARVRAEIAALADVTAQYKLPPINHGEAEGAYSKRIAPTKGWAVLDCSNFQIDSYDKVEICDLLTPSTEFVCVKKMVRSASLSHLFAQGSVSSQLLKAKKEYRDRIKKEAAKLGVADKDFEKWISQPTFVYAIPTTKPGALSEALFFFSMVNLRQHVRVVRSTGCDVSLCKIEYAVPAVAKNPAPTKKAKPQSD